MGMLFARRRIDTKRNLTTKEVLMKNVKNSQENKVNDIPTKGKVEPKKEALPLKFKS